MSDNDAGDVNSDSGVDTESWAPNLVSGPEVGDLHGTDSTSEKPWMTL